MISVKNLTYEYPGKIALENVNFSIPHGSITALVGPNGAGKTTLMRCLAALHKPLNGEVYIDDVDVLENPRLGHRKLGYLQDFFGLYEKLSCRESLAFYAKAHSVNESEINSRVEETLLMLNLEDKIDENVTALSRGMRQRLAIGQAIIHRPKYILLDEPASGLDPEARHALAQTFLHLRDEGMTLLVSSHILAELDEYASHMLVLRNGKVIESGELKSHQAATELLLIEALPSSLLSAEVFLNTQLGAENIVMDGRRIKCQFSGSDSDKAALLTALVQQGIQLVHFGSVTKNMQDEYLKIIKNN